MRTLWCIITFRHKGRISHDERGVFWACDNCPKRMYVEWDEVIPSVCR